MLNLAHSCGCSSIAFPTIGTGNLKFPVDVVASTMFKVVMDFSSANPETTINDIRFVLYDKDRPTVTVSINNLLCDKVL